MAYKDPDKQREANRRAKARQRAKGMTSQGVTDTSSGAHVIPKRGKDIKCFEDLPPDVQATIERVSRINNDEEEYTAEKAKRTSAAINYQHTFPDRYD